ncbi:arsenate reductase family protein [Psychroflexus maritimus]|uniref:Arsenate reductase, glutaredoxin family n=1 Tax=Psychroflexus maritimus TaxID=2714865 RepID=A0A967E6C5_9FLAO|nr:hypothetical protein [Psychroflexus maritimus]NGZ89616.1 hypothetical protein [Psychroflexus maritimus]
MVTDKKLIQIYCNPKDFLTEKCIAVAKASKASIQIIDIAKDILTGTDWKWLAEMLDIEVSDLINTNHIKYMEVYGSNAQIDEIGAIKILQNSPEVLYYPIAVRGKRAIQAKSETAILKLHNSATGEVPIP